MLYVYLVPGVNELRLLSDLPWDVQLKNTSPYTSGHVLVGVGGRPARGAGLVMAVSAMEDIEWGGGKCEVVTVLLDVGSRSW